MELTPPRKMTRYRIPWPTRGLDGAHDDTQLRRKLWLTVSRSVSERQAPLDLTDRR